MKVAAAIKADNPNLRKEELDMNTAHPSRRLALVLLLVGVSLNARAAKWSFTGNMSQERTYPPAVFLPNSQVLIVGGYHRGLIVAVAELYDPSTGTFTTTGSLNTARYGASATPLSGEVLAAGGYQSEVGIYGLSGELRTVPLS